MKILKSIPKNREFFNEHGESLNKFWFIGLLGQLLSGSSLAYAVYSILLDQVHVYRAILIIAALAVGILVEGSSRILSRPAIKPFVVKDLFQGESELRRRHRILNRSYLIGLAIVGILSYVLSGIGSFNYAEDSVPIPQLVNIDSIQEAFNHQLNAIGSKFAGDTAMISTPFNLRLQSIRISFIADSSALANERARLRTCANNGNTYCKSKRRRILSDIEKAKSAMADSINAITALKTSALIAFKQNRDQETEGVNSDRQEELVAAKSLNKQMLTEVETGAWWKGLIFLVLTVIGQTIFYYMTYLQLQVEAGSGIERDLEPNEFWNLPSVISEFRETLAWRIEGYARGGMAKLFADSNGRLSAAKNTDIPFRAIWEVVDKGQKEDILNQEQITEENGKIDGQQKNGIEPANGRRYRARVREGASQVGSVHQCRNCGEDYVKTVWNKVYCSEDCKLEAAAKKHGGKRFEPGKYRKAKKSRS